MCGLVPNISSSMWTSPQCGHVSGTTAMPVSSLMAKALAAMPSTTTVESP